MRIDLTGKRFGMAVAQWPVGRIRSYVAWLIKCDCGKLAVVSSGNLLSGNTSSCGCGKRLNALRHGHARVGHQSSEYASFMSALDRCTNPRNKRFKTYGGRSILFKFDNFEEFFSAVGPKPLGLVLDRKNNDGHYEKENVRWVTRLESARNTTRTKK